MPSNEFYDSSGYPTTGAPGSSTSMRAELDAIEAGFLKLPTMAGNGDLPVFVNAEGTALETKSTAAALTALGGEDTTKKDAPGGYAGLTLFKINFMNAIGTIKSFFTNANTAARTYTFQDRDGTIADNIDLESKANIASPTFTGTVSGVTKAMVGLGNVDNTSDLDKPVSTAQQSALGLKANLSSPTFTGVPLAPTTAAGANNSQIATTAFVQGENFYKKANILGTVSQLSGVPTGAIIERGSNSNGEYVRFADGTQICTIHVSDSTGSYTWTFPAEFILLPVVVTQGSYSSDTSFVFSVSNTLLNSSVVIKTFNVSLSAIVIRTSSINLRITAIGRWF